jgi:hypothetical protein
MLARLRPDILLLGGDYVTASPRFIEPLAALLGQVPAPLGRYAVLGNHDLWAGDEPIIAALEAAGITVLVNRSQQLPAPYDHLWLCGLDDPTAGEPNVARMLERTAGLRILLMHSPEGLDVLGQERFALALCGHTHGGQVALPGGRPILLPRGRWNRRYPAGIFTLDRPAGATLVVSRGVGFSGLPLRLFAPADIVVVENRWSASTRDEQATDARTASRTPGP